MIDYEALAVRSLDVPLDPDERATLRVWADVLEAAGDPRGALISLEHAVRDEPGRRHELRRATSEHVMANAGHLLGALGAVVRFKRALTLDWRSGLLYGAFLDSRYVAVRARLTPTELLRMLLGAPAAATLRRLHVRVRFADQVQGVLDALAAARPALPLEEIIVLSEVRTSQLSPPHPLGRDPRPLVATYPALRLLVDASGVCALPLPLSSTQAAPDAALARDLATRLPDTASGRVMLGRALLRPEPALRAVALRRIAELGERAFMFVEVLMMLLAPGIVSPQAPIVECLAGLGARARLALPLLATITGRVEHYDLDTRRAAGIAIAAMADDLR